MSRASLVGLLAIAVLGCTSCGRSGYDAEDDSGAVDSGPADSGPADSGPDGTSPPSCDGATVELVSSGTHDVPVPPGCTALRAMLWGAGGGSGGPVEGAHHGGDGGGGAFVGTGRVILDGVDQVTVTVGDGGRRGHIGSCSGGGGGGGASSLLVRDRAIAVAGGGGAGGGGNLATPIGRGRPGQPGQSAGTAPPSEGATGLDSGPCDAGFGGSGGFGGDASGGSGGCRNGGGGGGGGAPGGDAGTEGVCSAVREGAAGYGGRGGGSFALEPVLIQAGSLRNPGNVDQAEGAGTGGLGHPGLAASDGDGMPGRVVLVFES